MVKRIVKALQEKGYTEKQIIHAMCKGAPYAIRLQITFNYDNFFT